MADKIPIEFLDRKGTDCMKWDLFNSTRKDAIMMWVLISLLSELITIPRQIADTEIATPEPVYKAILKRAQHRAYGSS